MGAVEAGASARVTRPGVVVAEVAPVRGWGVVLLAGVALGVTSWWHGRAGGWWPLVVLTVVLVAAAVVYGVSRRDAQ